jgi:hypothetical protein
MDTNEVEPRIPPRPPLPGEVGWRESQQTPEAVTQQEDPLSVKTWTHRPIPYSTQLKEAFLKSDGAPAVDYRAQNRYLFLLCQGTPPKKAASDEELRAIGHPQFRDAMFFFEIEFQNKFVCDWYHRNYGRLMYQLTINGVHNIDGGSDRYLHIATRQCCLLWYLEVTKHPDILCPDKLHNRMFSKSVDVHSLNDAIFQCVDERNEQLKTEDANYEPVLNHWPARWHVNKSALDHTSFDGFDPEHTS